jgi:hypothetical protein
MAAVSWSGAHVGDSQRGPPSSCEEIWMIGVFFERVEIVTIMADDVASARFEHVVAAGLYPCTFHRRSTL